MLLLVLSEDPAGGLTLDHLDFSDETSSFSAISCVGVPCTDRILNSRADVSEVCGRLHRDGGDAQVAAEKIEGAEGGASGLGDVLVPFQILGEGDSEVLEALDLFEKDAVERVGVGDGGSRSVDLEEAKSRIFD